MAGSKIGAASKDRSKKQGERFDTKSAKSFSPIASDGEDKEMRRETEESYIFPLSSSLSS
jgi:hypothetical protein